MGVCLDIKYVERYVTRLYSSSPLPLVYCSIPWSHILPVSPTQVSRLFSCAGAECGSSGLWTCERKLDAGKATAEDLDLLAGKSIDSAAIYIKMAITGEMNALYYSKVSFAACVSRKSAEHISRSSCFPPPHILLVPLSSRLA